MSPKLLSAAAVLTFLSCGPDTAFVVENEADDLEVLTADLDSTGMLTFLNGPTATFDVLDGPVGLDARAATGIVAHVRGPDGKLGTSDDDRFDSIAELDAVPWVGTTAMNAIHRYAVGLTRAVGGIRVIRAATVATIPSGKPAPGTYRVHLIDVGTGLAILVQGADFTLLFDGGSTDDSAGISASGNKSRLLAYLAAAVGPASDPACRPEGDSWNATPPMVSPEIDHVFLSHPHQDHSNMLDEVIRCYRVKHVWDSGAKNDTASYASFLTAVAAEPGVTFHTAAAVPPSRQVSVWGQTIAFPRRPRGPPSRPEIAARSAPARPSPCSSQTAGITRTSSTTTRPCCASISAAPACCWPQTPRPVRVTRCSRLWARSRARCSTSVARCSTSTSSRWRTTAR
jgi:hypothetical protein